MLIRLSKFEYLLAGSGVVIDFKTPTEKQQEQQKTLGEDGFAEAAANSTLHSSLFILHLKLGASSLTKRIASASSMTMVC